MKNRRNVKNNDLALIEKKLPKTHKHNHNRTSLNKISISDNMYSQISKYPNNMTDIIKVSKFRTIYFKNKNLDITTKSKKIFNLNINNKLNYNNFSLSIKKIKKFTTENKLNKKNIINNKSNIKSFSPLNLGRLNKRKLKIEKSNLNYLKSANCITKKFKKIYYGNTDKNRNMTQKIGEKYTSYNKNFSPYNQKNIEKIYKTENNNLDINNSETDELSELSKLSDNTTGNNKVILYTKLEQLLIKFIKNKYRKSILKNYMNKWFENIYFKLHNNNLGNTHIIKKNTFSMGDYLKISDIVGLRKCKQKNSKSQQFNINKKKNHISSISIDYFNQINKNGKKNQNNGLFNLKKGENIKKLNKKNISCNNRKIKKSINHSKKLSCIIRLHKTSNSIKEKEKLINSNQFKKYRFVKGKNSKEKTVYLKIDFCK